MGDALKFHWKGKTVDLFNYKYFLKNGNRFKSLKLVY